MAPRAEPWSFAGRVLVVTGAAQGVGEATARLMAARGAAGLALLDRNRAGIEALAGELERGPEAIGTPAYGVGQLSPMFGERRVDARGRVRIVVGNPARRIGQEARVQGAENRAASPSLDDEGVEPVQRGDKAVDEARRPPLVVGGEEVDPGEARGSRRPVDERSAGPVHCRDGALERFSHRVSERR